MRNSVAMVLLRLKLLKKRFIPTDFNNQINILVLKLQFAEMMDKNSARRFIANISQTNNDKILCQVDKRKIIIYPNKSLYFIQLIAISITSVSIQKKVLSIIVQLI